MDNKSIGYIDSVYCGSGVDGRGLRCVVFFSGCNLRCPFCHNPETLFKRGQETLAEDLANKLKRYKPYFKKGGVTLSGGEPFLQKDFLLCLVGLLKKERIHVVAETNGQIADAEILSVLDGVIVDVKNQEDDNLKTYEKFFDLCEVLGCEYKITNVLVPGKNDSEAKLTDLGMLAKRRGHTIKFLPFRKLCVEKYENLGLLFAYRDIPEAEPDDEKKAYEFIERIK